MSSVEDEEGSKQEVFTSMGKVDGPRRHQLRFFEMGRERCHIRRSRSFVQ